MERAPPSLPMDAISEILSRTPVKSVCRFRCVSKAWQSLISNAAFLATHREPLYLIVANSMGADQDGSRDHDLRLMDLDGNIIKVIKRAGTLLMMCSSAVNGPPICVTLDQSTFNVVDLAAGNVIATSKGENTRDYTTFNYGVGCAIPSGTYKLVFLARSQTCKVLTLQDGAEWRQTQPSPAPVPFLGYRQFLSVTVNGIMHFFYHDSTAPWGCENLILCFDLESEEWKESIRGPVRVMRDFGACMTKLNDILCIVQWEERVTHVWLLTDSVESTWVKAYTIRMAPAIHVEIPLRMRDSGKLLVLCSPCHLTSTTTLTLQDYDPLMESHTHLINFPGLHRLYDVSICRMDLKSVVSSKIFTVVEPKESNLPLI